MPSLHRVVIVAASLFFLGLAPCAQKAVAQLPPSGPYTGPVAPLHEDAALASQLQAEIAAFPGNMSLYAQDLASGQFVALRADEPVATASVIKLTILYYALEQIRAGHDAWNETLTLTKADQVPGSGVLLFFNTPLTLTLQDALYMMVVVSDNTATNLLIDHFGVRNIDDQILALGLKYTWLYKRIMLPPTGPMPADQPKFGLGKTTAREMAEVMTRFVTCDLGPYTGAGAGAPTGPLCAKALTILGDQFYRDAIPRYLDPNNIPIANKTGAVNGVRNDVAAVFARGGPIVISAFTWGDADDRWTADNTAELLEAKIARQIVDAWQAPDHPKK